VCECRGAEALREAKLAHGGALQLSKGTYLKLQMLQAQGAARAVGARA